MAAKGGHLGVVRVLVKADVNAHNNSGETPLHWAARWGHLDVVRVLVSEFKADVNAHNNGGETPMDIAVSNKKQEVAVILMNETWPKQGVRSCRCSMTALTLRLSKCLLSLCWTAASQNKADCSMREVGSIWS